MDAKQSYFDFLANQGAKQKVKDIIAKGIEEWKKHLAYEWKPSTNDFDYSGGLHQIFNKETHKPMTIGEICKTDMDVLLSYSGNSEATYCSRWGLRYPSVAEDISWEINKCLCGLRGEWIMKHRDELMDGCGEDYIGEEWSDDDIIEYVDENVLTDDYFNYDWMEQKFPEYIHQEDGVPMGPELIFNIDN